MNPSNDKNESVGDTGVWEGGDLANQLGPSDGDDKPCIPGPENGRSGSEQLPKFIGRYPIERWIGRGAYGSVYLGQHPGLKRKVAVKLMKLDIADSREATVKRYSQEALITDRLNHPNIIRVYDVGEDKMNGFYIVMEYAEGGDVAALLKDKKAVDVDFAVRIVKGVANALVEANKFNIIHRDIKPQNIMLTQDGEIKLADLGLAKITHVDSDMSLSCRPRGTPVYMAPEQVKDAKHVDARADIYALGATFYELVTGKRPFEGTELYDIFVKKAESGKFKKPSLLKPDLDPQVEKIICKMMAFAPKDRYGSASELLKVLNAYLPLDSVQVHAKPRKPLIISAALLIVSIILVLVLQSDRSALYVTSSNTDWQQSLYKFASRIETNHESVKDLELPENLAEKRNQIDGRINQARSNLNNGNYNVAATLYFGAQLLVRELNASCASDETSIKLNKRTSKDRAQKTQGSESQLASDRNSSLPESDPLNETAEQYIPQVEDVGPRGPVQPDRRLSITHQSAKLTDNFKHGQHKGLYSPLANAGSQNPMESSIANLRSEDKKTLIKPSSSIYFDKASELVSSADEYKPKAVVELTETNNSAEIQIASSTSTAPQRQHFLATNSSYNNASVAQSIATVIPNRQIGVMIRSEDGKQYYKENEVLSLRLRPDKDCYVAVLCHYSDGQSVLLFPNEFNQDNFISAGSTIAIPGPDTGNFELYIHEPFGTDIVQIIACSDKSAIKQFLDITLAENQTLAENPFAVVNQQAIKRGLPRAKRAIGYRPQQVNDTRDVGSNPTIDWGEVQLPIYTSPADGNKIGM